VPLVGWGAFALSRGEESPPAQPTESDALGALVPTTQHETAPAAVPPPSPVEKSAGEDPGVAGDDGDEPSADDESTADDDSDHDGADDTDSDDVATGAEQGFWIQVASLRLKEKADRMAAKLKNKGYDARSMAYGGPRAGWWHVVRIGPYVTRLEAEKAKLAFVRAERGTAAVVPRAHGPFNIQIASLRSEARAKTAAGRLNRLGHNARVGTLKTSKRGVWHTIRVGPFDFETDAWGYLKLLEKDGVKGEITPRPKNPPPAEEPTSAEEPASAEEPVAEEPAAVEADDEPAVDEDLPEEEMPPSEDSDSF